MRDSDRRRFHLRFGFLAAMLVVPLSDRSAATAPISDPQARSLALREISQELVCKCGCNMILSECSHQNCPFALPEREKILAAIDRGESQRTIIDRYVADYGRAILSAPPTDRTLLDRLAWWVPILAGGIGLVVVSLFARRFARAGDVPIPDGAVESPELAALRARVEADVARGEAGER